jgi:Tfp pilus assembly protein PilX
MKQPVAPSKRSQAGAANMLIALVLSMSVTLVTLAVAKTLLTEQSISTNTHWHARLALE